MKIKTYLVALTLIFVFNRDGLSQSYFDNHDLIVGASSFPSGNDIQPMLFYKEGSSAKGAFRSGWITDDSWNANKLGNGSIGVGINAEASGSYSASFGDNTISTGGVAFSIGHKSQANGYASFAGGENSSAHASNSFSFGNYNTVFGIGSVAFGDSTYSNGKASFSAGKKVYNEGNYAQAFGYNTIATADYATAFGQYTLANKPHMFAVGRFNYAPTSSAYGGQHLFVVGDGSVGSNSNALTVMSTGRVGIDVDDPCQKLQVAGNITYSGVVACSSDRRYKKNIKELDSTLDIVNKIKPVQYFLKTEDFPHKEFSESKQIGFIAQDIQKYFPELVVDDGNGYLSVDYGKMTPILLRAIQELSKELETLKTQQKSKR